MDLRIRAGNKVLEMIKDGNFNLDRITTYVGPAVGPRWLVASGFDLTLLERGVLGRTKPVLLAGASAGAWRFAAWLQPEPEKSYRRLINAYFNLSYSQTDTPARVLQSLSQAVDAYIDSDALPFALANKKYRLAVTTARARHLTGSDSLLIQRLGFAGAFAANAISPTLLHRFFECVVFYCAPIPPKFCLRDEFRGKAIRLNVANFRDAVLASGAIPMLVSGVRDIFGAPNGVYRDGGIFDYHLNHEYATKEGEVTLLFHHQGHIIPGWLDKRLKSRRASRDLLDNLLMVYPQESVIKRLPNGKVPDREDFVTFLNRPAERIAAWREAVTACTSFGEQFLDVIESGRLAEVVQPL